MAKGYFDRFTEWQNYAHYLLNAVFITFYYVMFGNFNKTVIGMFFELFIVLTISDSIVHFIFWNLPKPYRWRD